MSKDGKNKKDKRWTSARHRFLVGLTLPFFYVILKIRYHVTLEKFADKKRQYFVLMNHQTSSDQFFVSLVFGGHMYFFATEDIFSNGFISTLLRWSVNPIPINKSTADMRAIINSIKVAKEGGSICLAPEGNRTYDGRTCTIKPSVIALIRKLNLPLALFRIDGGYGVQPRWADKNRKGKMTAGVKRVLEPEEYSKLSDDGLYSVILETLKTDESGIGGEFKGKHKAEYMERLFYVCKKCGFSTFKTFGNTVACNCCGNSSKLSDANELLPLVNGIGFRTIGEWYDYQQNFVRNYDVSKYIEKSAFTDTVKVIKVIPYKKKQVLNNSAVASLFGNRIHIVDSAGNILFDWMFTDIKSITALGRKKMNVRTAEGIYQIKADKHFNPVKYINFFYSFVNRNDKNGGNDNEFLGL